MIKSHLGYKSLTSLAAMMLSVTAAQNALAQSRDRDHHHHNNSGSSSSSSSGVTDPGVRGGPAGAGASVGGLTTAQQAFFTAAQARFNVIETVPAGLGPGFNELSCGLVTYLPRSAVRAPRPIPR